MRVPPHNARPLLMNISQAVAGLPGTVFWLWELKEANTFLQSGGDSYMNCLMFQSDLARKARGTSFTRLANVAAPPFRCI